MIIVACMYGAVHKVRHAQGGGGGGGGGGSLSQSDDAICDEGGGVHIGQKSVTYFKNSPYAPGVYNQMSRATSPLDQ